MKNILQRFFKNKNILDNVSIETIDGNLEVGDRYGLDEKAVEQLFEKKINVQNSKINEIQEVSNSKQTQELKVAFKEILQQQNLSNDFEELNKHFETDIELIKEDISKNNVNSALTRLLSLKDNSWDKANNNIKFKILSNIGVIYSKTDKLKEAAKYFIEAYRLFPDNEKAINNVTIALIYLNKYDDEIVQNIKKHAPEKAVSLDIRFNAKDKPIEYIVSKLDKKYLNDINILLSIANHAHKLKDFDNAIKYSRKAYNIDKNSITQKENLANSIFVKFEGYSQFSFSYTNNSKDKELIREATSLYKECWDIYKVGDTSKYKIDIKAKLSILYSLLGNPEKALQNINVALEKEKADEYYRKFKALFLSQTDRFDEAIEIFSSISDFEKHPDVPISLAYNYFFKKNNEEAIKILRDYIKIGKNSQFVKNAGGLLIDILLQSKQFSEALEVIEECLIKGNNDFDFITSKSRALNFLGEIEAAKEILNSVLSNLESVYDDRTITYVAKALEEQGRVKEAVRLYEKSFDLSLNNDMTYKVAYLYTTINRKDKALDVYKNLRENYGIIENITKNEIALYQEMGENSKAKKVAEEYLNIFSDDLYLKVSLIGINFYLGFHQENLKLLNENIDFLSLDINHFSTYIALLNEYNQHDIADKCIYEAWRHFRNVEYNDLYLSYYFQPSLNKKKTFETPDKVEMGSVVYLSNDNESGEYYFIFEDKPENELKQNEKNTNSEIYKLLEGKKAGDKIQISQFPLKEYVKVNRILHKYIYALNEARKLSSSIYKGKSGFKQFNIDKLKEFIENEANKGELLNIEEADYLKAYKQKKIPIGFFSPYYNESFIKTWFNHVSSDRGIECSIGLPDEMSHTLISLEKLKSFKNIYVDIYTLLTLYFLNSKEEIINNFNIIISPETKKIIDDFIYWLKNIGSVDIFVSYFFKAIEQINIEKIKPIVFFNNLKNWVNINVKIQPSPEFLKQQHKEEKKLIKAFSKSTYQTFILAKQNNGVTIVDDFASRSFLEKKFNVSSAWSQSMLLHFKNKNLISDEKYIKDVIILASLNYKFTSINKDTLFESIIQSEFKLKHPFMKVADILDGHVSSPTSLLIGVGFLFDFLSKSNKLDDDDKYKVTFHIITRLFLGRTLKDTYELIYYLILKQAVENESEANYIFGVLGHYIKTFRKDDLIEEHPYKYRLLLNQIYYLKHHK